jgi:hypothetical protein
LRDFWGLGKNVVGLNTYTLADTSVKRISNRTWTCRTRSGTVLVRFVSLGTILDMADEFRDRTCISLLFVARVKLAIPSRPMYVIYTALLPAFYRVL